MIVTFLKRLFPTILLITILGGCVASGGGSPVRFSPQNSQEIVLSPFYLSDPSKGADHAWYLTLEVSDKIPIAGFLKPNQMMMESFAHWIYSLRPVAGKPLVVPSQAIAQGCQGALSGQLTLEAAGAFKGQLVFENYADDCTLILSGEVPFEGNLGLASGDMVVEMELEALRATLGSRELQYKGDLQLEFNASAGKNQVTTLVSDLALSDESGPRYSLDDMKFVWDPRGHYPQATIAGRLNYVGQGSVELTTESPIYINQKRGQPFDGALLFHGADQSWIRLLFAKPALPGFFRIDGSDGLETKGQL